MQKLALTFWLGEMLFFVTIFAPRVFKVLPRDLAGQLQNNIFPAYFVAGIACAFIILVTQLLIIQKNQKGIYWAKTSVAEARGPGRRYGPLVFATIAGLIFAYCYVMISPRLAELQPQMAQSVEAVKAEFDSLHRLSVSLNGAALICLLILLGLL
jgi:hypothetical protein